MSQNLFKWKHFESEIILLCVRWYIKYPLSYRMMVEIMAERGIAITHTTIMRWVQQYSPIINERMRKHLKKTNDSWRMDETYIEIMHMIRKGQVEEIQCVLFEVEFISKIMGVAA